MTFVEMIVSVTGLTVAVGTAAYKSEDIIEWMVTEDEPAYVLSIQKDIQTSQLMGVTFDQLAESCGLVGMEL
jgi:hypothetical protein